MGQNKSYRVFISCLIALTAVIGFGQACNSPIAALMAGNSNSALGTVPSPGNDNGGGYGGFTSHALVAQMADGVFTMNVQSASGSTCIAATSVAEFVNYAQQIQSASLVVAGTPVTCVYDIDPSIIIQFQTNSTITVNGQTYTYENGTLVLTSTSGDLSAEPSEMYLGSYQTARLLVSGGVPPYTYAVTQPQACLITSTGQLATTGNFTGECDIVVTDASGSQVDVRAVSNASSSPGSVLQLQPAQSQISPTASLQLLAVGGKPPYTYSITSVGNPANPSQCTVSANTGLFTAGQALESCMLKVTDSTGASATGTANVVVNAKLPIASPLPTSSSTVLQTSADGLLIQPAVAFFSAASSLQLVPTGGSLPYTYSTEGTGSCTVTAAGIVMDDVAPDFCLIRVTDAGGNAVTEIVNVTSP